MAFKFGDGFDLYASSADLGRGRWDIVGAGTITFNTGRFTGNYINFGLATSTIVKNFGGTSQTIFVTIASIWSSTFTPGGTTVGGYIQLRDGATPQVTLTLTNGGDIQVRTGGVAGTVAATFASAFAGSTWNGWTFKIVIHNTTGSVEARRDGATSNTFAATNINTRGGTTNNYVNAIALGSNDPTLDGRFDDLMIYDDQGAAPNTWAGDVRIQTLMPNADTAQKDFSRSTGSNNFALVDEAQQNGDTDYVFSSTLNHKDLYDFGGLGTVAQTIYAVQSMVLARKTAAGPTNAQLRVKSDATEVAGDDLALAGRFLYQTRVDTTDPNTGLPWTSTAVDALQVGPLVTAVSGATDSSFANVTLLLQPDGVNGSRLFTDLAPTPHALTTNGDAFLDTSQFKFGNASLRLDGNGDFLSASDNNAFSLDGGDFTLEAWIRKNVTTFGIVAGKYSNSTTTAEWFFGASSTVLDFLAFWGTGGSDFIRITAATTINAGQWYHVAVERSGNTFRVYQDGVVIGTLSDSHALKNSTQPFWIGAINHPTPSYFDGWIDDLRITKGLARYAGAFTPPTAMFPGSGTPDVRVTQAAAEVFRSVDSVTSEITVSDTLDITLLDSAATPGIVSRRPVSFIISSESHVTHRARRATRHRTDHQISGRRSCSVRNRPGRRSAQRSAKSGLSPPGHCTARGLCRRSAL